MPSANNKEKGGGVYNFSLDNSRIHKFSGRVRIRIRIRIRNRIAASTVRSGVGLLAREVESERFAWMSDSSV